MNRIRHLTFLLTLSILAVPALFGQEAAEEVAAPVFGASLPSFLFDGREYREVSATEDLRLLVEAETATFIVEDRRSGHLWTSFVPSWEPEYQKTNRVWQRNMMSLFLFSVVSLRDDQANRRNSSLLATENTIETSFLPGGVRFDVKFPTYRLGLSVEVMIQNDTLSVRIPQESIVEETDVVFVSITPIPFLGYAKPTDEGYMLVPDGSGALYRYKPAQSGAMASEKRVSWYVYGPEEVDFRKYFEIEDDLLKTAYLPVFGVKVGDHAFIASLDEGDTDAYIHLSESGFSVDLNRMNAEFTVRHSYELFLSSIRVQGGMDPWKSIVPTRYDPERIPVNRTMRLQFLTGEQATYSGMATGYRRHLQSLGVLATPIGEGEIPLVLSLFGGIFEERLLFDKFVPMTSFGNANRIIEALLERDVASIQANLIGWSKKGYEKFPINWPPDRRLGGKSGLRRLADDLDEAVTLYLQLDPVHAIAGNGRFNKRTDVVRALTSISVRSNFYDEELYFLNPQEASERLSSVVEDLARLGVDGITFEAIGDVLFHDYNPRAPSQRHETLDSWVELARKSDLKLGAAAIVRGNIRQADTVDLILELPMETSGYMIIDEMVPFYQMVLHGNVYYTTDPENLFYDTRRQFLTWIETGAVPYYVLTYESSELLAFTGYNHLFTSYFEDWVDVAAGRYHEFNREFGDFYHLAMIDHTRITDEVVQVTFEDGSRILLNYGDEAVTLGGITVESLDYRTVRSGSRSAGGPE